jgi:hypothetical protein
MSNEIEINFIIREAKRLTELKFNEITFRQINHKLIEDQVFTTPLHDYHKFRDNHIRKSSKMLSPKFHPNLISLNILEISGIISVGYKNV